jgi:hypothetical protein
MADKPLDNFSREELLALVQEQQLRIESLQRQLGERVLVMDEAGSIAQAALALSGVFQASQQAADRYLESVEHLKARQEADYNQRLAQAEVQCREMVARAEQGAQFYWDALNRRIEALMAGQTALQTESSDSTDETAEASFGPDD